MRLRRLSAATRSRELHPAAERKSPRDRRRGSVGRRPVPGAVGGGDGAAGDRRTTRGAKSERQAGVPPRVGCARRSGGDGKGRVLEAGK